MLRAALLAVLLATAAASAQTDALVTREYALRFSLDAPDGWETYVDQGVMRLLVRSPEVRDNFHPNVNVVVDGLPAGTTLDAYVRATLTQLESQMPGYRAVESDPTTLNGRVVYRGMYEHTITGRPLRVLTYSVVEGSRAYVLTATATPGTFTDLLPRFEQICESFQVE